MAYIIHYTDNNPNEINEEIILLDSKPTADEIEEYRPYHLDEETVHHISDEDWPSSLPLDRCLKPSF